MTAALVVFTPKGGANVANVLPETRAAELRLRAEAAKLGIEYDFPDFSGLRTPAITAQLIRWRDEAVAAARKAGEAKRRAQGGTAVQIKDAGDVAASRAYYRVSAFAVGFHGKGGAFDIRIRKVPAGMTVDAGYKALGALAGKCGLRWGGTFSRPADPFHFELLRPLEDVAALWTNYARTSAAVAATSRTPVIVALAVLVVLGLVASRFATSPGSRV